MKRTWDNSSPELFKFLKLDSKWLICVLSFAVVGQDAGDTGAEFDRVFVQELRDLRVFVNDKDTVDEHKRSVKLNAHFSLQQNIYRNVFQR